MRPKSPQKLLRRSQTSLYLVTDPVNIRYLSGVGVSAGAMLVTRRGFFLFVDARYAERAKREAFAGIKVFPLDDLRRHLRRGAHCGFESEKVSVERRARWSSRFPGVTFVRRPGVVEHFRRRKDPAELRYLRRASRITRELLRLVPRALRPGITEEQLARQLALWALERGAEGLAFDPIVAFGTHTASPHHAPTRRKLRRGHLVQIDVGAKVNGYCADMSAVFFTAPPTLLQRNVHHVLRAVQRASMCFARAGVTNRALDAEARAMLRDEGWEQYFTHALGHGVGLEIHEGVTLSQKQPEEKLLSGEVITIEPGVYFPRRFGMRVEEMVYVR